MQEQIIDKKLKFYVIDAYEVAQDTGMGGRINTIMQTCFFAITGVLPRDEAIEQIKNAIEKTYGKRGEAVVQKNFAAVDATLEHLHEVKVPGHGRPAPIEMPPAVPAEAPEFVQNVTAHDHRRRGRRAAGQRHAGRRHLPHRHHAVGEAQHRPGGPGLGPDVCIQCGKCVLVCPHAVIRAKVYDAADLAGAPATFKSADAKLARSCPDKKYTLQVAVEDCTGCGCASRSARPRTRADVGRKAINMEPQLPLREHGARELGLLPEPARGRSRTTGSSSPTSRTSSCCEPLFEFSGACAGCGETPYVKLVTQLFGDRAMIANATGCSSIYGGNLPTTPWTYEQRRPRPGLVQLAVRGQRRVRPRHAPGARQAEPSTPASWWRGCADAIGDDLVDGLLDADQADEAGIAEQRERVAAAAREAGRRSTDPDVAATCSAVADALVKKSVWIVGGDGWAYDIGYGGLDHVLATGRNVNVLVLDTEVYSNTGGQASKATPLRRGGQVRRRRQADAQEGPGHDGHELRQRLRGAGRHGRQRRADRAGPSWKPRPTTARRSSSPTATASPTASTWPRAWTSRSWRCDSGHWPLYRYNPRAEGAGQEPVPARLQGARRCR